MTSKEAAQQMYEGLEDVVSVRLLQATEALLNAQAHAPDTSPASYSPTIPASSNEAPTIKQTLRSAA